MSAARIISMLFLQIGELALQVSDGTVWGLGLIVTFSVVLVEMFRLAIAVTTFGLDDSPPDQLAVSRGGASLE